jgi:hypothetical protein
MDHRLVAVHEKNKMANVGSSRHFLCDLGIDRDFARNVKVGEVDAES